MLQDKSLIRIIYRETVGRYSLVAIITRFGGLSVCVYEDAESGYAPYQCENILDARTWAQNNP